MKDRYARDIASRFPYPIAAPFARLRTEECMDPGLTRLKYILATGEAVARFCGILVLCECRATLEDQAADSRSEVLSKDLHEWLRAPSWGGWLQVMREGLKWLRSQDLKPQCCDLTDFMLDRRGRPSINLQALTQLLELRNRLSHDKLGGVLHARDFERLCEESFPALEQVLAGLDFLMDYELTFVSEIHVHKRRRHKATFHHRFKVFGGESDTFSGDRETRPRYCESQTIILKALDSSVYLNLDPFFIYDEKTGRAPDLFFFNGLKRGDCADYSACKHGGAFVSSDSPSGSQIAEEFGNLRSLFAGPGARDNV